VFGGECSACNSEGCSSCGTGYTAVGPENHKVCVTNTPDSEYCAAAFGEGCTLCEAQKCTDVNPGFFISSFGRAYPCNLLPSPVIEAGVVSLRAMCCSGLNEQEREGCMSDKPTREVLVVDDVDNELITFTYTIMSGPGGDIPVSGEVTGTCSQLTNEQCSKCNVEQDGDVVLDVACAECKAGYFLHGEECLSCDKFGSGCGECTASECTKRTCGENMVAVGATCDNCADVIQNCEVCDNAKSCKECKTGFIKGKDGMCYAPMEIGSLDNGKCTTVECCEARYDGKTYIDRADDGCGTCADFIDGCSECNSMYCTACSEKDGSQRVVVNNECTKCEDLFENCGECDSYMCTKCKPGQLMLTINGCVDVSKPDEPGGGGQPTSPVSQPVAPTSTPDEGSNAGMIVGIVIGVLVVIALISVAVYCIVTAGAKRGKIDPVIYEEDPEFISMSVL